MKGVHGPGPKRGSMDQGSMFCPLPLICAISQRVALNRGCTAKKVEMTNNSNQGHSTVLLLRFQYFLSIPNGLSLYTINILLTKLAWDWTDKISALCLLCVQTSVCSICTVKT